MTKLYYEAPSDEAFEDMRKSAIEVWTTYDDTHSYASEKINRIKDIKNIEDNFMYIFAMFDINNQKRVAQRLKPATRTELYLRLVDGGNTQEFIKSILD